MMADEKRDLLVLVCASVLIPLVWLIGFGWTPGTLLESGDAEQWLPRTAQLMAQGGDWERLLYRADTLGGAVIVDVAGKSPTMDVAGLLGLSATAALNFSVLITQILVAFFGTKTTLDLGRLWGAPERRHTWPLFAPLVVIFAYAPYVAARLAAGHLDLLYGHLLFIALLSFVVALKAERLTVVCALLAALALAICFPTHGHQLKLYGFVFGMPLFVAAVWPTRAGVSTRTWLKGNWRPLVGGIGVAVGALFLILPRFIGMLAYARSGDAVRSLAAEPMVYSYMTSTLQDWWGSVPLHKGLTYTDRDPYFLHETAFGLGPWLLVVFALASFRKFAWAAALVISGALIYLFSADGPIVPEVLMTILPPMAAFRVPSRAAMILGYVLPVLTCALFLAKSDALWSKKSLIIGAVIAGVFFFLSVDAREIVLWSVAFTTIALLAIRPKFARVAHLCFAAGPLIIIFALGQYSAARDWQPSLVNTQKQLEDAQEFGAKSKAQYPELDSDLTRVTTQTLHPLFRIHMPMAIGLSSLSAYVNPTRRFLGFLSGLSGTEIPASTVYLPLVEPMPGFEILRQLYNVGYRLEPTQQGLQLQKLGPTMGPGWFSYGIEQASSAKELTSALRGAGERLRDLLGARVLIDGSDAKTQVPPIAAGEDPACRNAKLEKMTEGQNRQSFTASVQTPANCPLTLAMNYVEFLKASVKNAAGETREALVFPAYGTLTGIWVPAGSTTVEIEAVPRVPAGVRLLFWLGWIILAGSLVLLRPRSKN